MAARRRNKAVIDIEPEEIEEPVKPITRKAPAKKAALKKVPSQPELLEGAAKQEQPKNIIQDMINDTLYKTTPISAFVTEAIVTRVKNTVGIVCRKCGSDNVYSESRQLRSGDEAASILYACLNCGQKWRVG